VRAPRALVVVVAVAALLTGCVSVPSSGVHGGQSAQRVVLDLELSGGISDATYTTTVTAQPGEGGLGAGASVHGELTVNITEYAGLTDAKAAVDRLLRTVWSIGDQKPDTIGITIVGGVAQNDLQWYALVRKLYDSGTAPTAGRVTLAAKDAARLFGTWPGTKPKDQGRFTTATMPTSPTPSPVGVDGLRASTYNGQPNFEVSLHRAVLDDASYTGTITAVLIADGEVVATRDADFDASRPDNRVFFSLLATAVPKSATVRLSFTPQDGFDTATVELPVPHAAK